MKRPEDKPISAEPKAQTASAPNSDRRKQEQKKVPAEFDVRRSIRAAAARTMAAMSRREPLGRDRLQELGRSLLRDLDLPEMYLGFAMVEINNSFWREQFAAVPLRNRLLLLPHCLRDIDRCKGTHDVGGLTCADCGACRISPLKRKAEALGYTVIVAEGTPEVLKALLVERTDALLGVACLDSLEAAFNCVAELGIPNAAVPLLVDGCVNTTVEFDRIDTWMTLEHTKTLTEPERTRSYVPLLRMTKGLFESGTLEALLIPEVTAQPSITEPLTGTEAIAMDCLRAGGKRFRPFITLAAYASRAVGSAALLHGSTPDELFGETVKRAAVAVEAFHKASLVHDDIEDDDAWRHGVRTVHERYGTAVAVNVGDYLIGLGYQLLAESRDELGGECAADILSALTRAHVALSRGQGAELLRRLTEHDELKPLEVLTTYALKTAPAFEAAITVGLRIAGPIDSRTARELHTYSRNLGVAYQILNDLKDFEEDPLDKISIGGDLVARRPTVLLAFAHASCDDAERRSLHELLDSDADVQTKVRELSRLYAEHGVFDKARTLVDKYRQRTHAVSAGGASPALSGLLRFITDVVLK